MAETMTMVRKKTVLVPRVPLPATVRAKPLPPIGRRKLARSTPPEPTVHRINVLDLKDDMCRWPIGDPRDDDFEFCAAPKRASCSYCEEHASRAVVKGSNAKPVGLPRSLIGRAA